MSNFASASAALTAALAVVDTRLTNTDDNTPIELYIELVDRRAKIQQAIAASGGSGGTVVLGSGSSTIGAIANTAFGISGTLPAFSVRPTFDIGTAPNLTFTNTAFTANAGTNLNTSLLALESGGNLAGINTKLPASLGAKAPSASLSVTQAFAATSTITNQASSATSVTLLAANNNRKTAIIINDSTSDLYVVFNASAASTTNYSLFLAAKVGNIPSSLILKGDDYSGEIRGIWSSANGFARITEVV